MVFYKGKPWFIEWIKKYIDEFSAEKIDLEIVLACYFIAGPQCREGA